MSESKAKSEIMLAVGSLPGVRLFNNPVGSAWQGNILQQTKTRLLLEFPRRITYGLFTGSHDLVGWKSITITPDMVGQTIAQFASVEVKAPGGTHPFTKEQRIWLANVEAAGGIGGVARSPDQALLALGLHPTERAA